MSLLAWFRQKLALLVSSSFSVAENENFIALMRAAQEDDAIRKKILSIVAITDNFHRSSLLGETQRSLTAQQAPKELIEALGFLKDQAICKKVGEILH